MTSESFDLYGNRFAPTTSSFGFLELPLTEAAAGLLHWRQQRHPDTTASPLDEPLADQLGRLAPLMGGARPRELLVSHGDHWSAYFDCSLRGTDAVSAIGHLSRTLRCQGLAIRCVPNTACTATRPARFGAVQFELFGPIKTDFINYVRTLSCTFDGYRWNFDASGTPQWFEDPARYQRRRIEDRFAPAMLANYCNALGITVFDEDAYGHDGVFFERAQRPVPGGYVMSYAEVQTWLGIVADSSPRTKPAATGSTRTKWWQRQR